MQRAAVSDVMFCEAIVIYHCIISVSVSVICLKLYLINISTHFSSSGSCEFLVIMNEPYFSFMSGLTLLGIDDNISDRIDFFKK